MITKERFNEIEDILTRIIVTQLSYGNFIYSKDEIIELMYEENITDNELEDFINIKEIKNKLTK